jgi:hypothetical protein
MDVGGAVDVHGDRPSLRLVVEDRAAFALLLLVVPSLGASRIRLLDQVDEGAAIALRPLALALVDRGHVGRGEREERRDERGVHLAKAEDASASPASFRRRLAGADEPGILPEDGNERRHRRHSSPPAQ